MVGIALDDDRVALASSVLSLLRERHGEAARASLDAVDDTLLPPFWKELADLGCLGLHLPEEFGGQGYTVEELVVVAEQLGREVAPGPFLPTVTASAVIAAVGDERQRARWLPGLADGSLAAGLGLWGALSLADGRLSGDTGPVLCAGTADVVLLAVGEDLVLLGPGEPGLTLEPAANLDLTRRSRRGSCSATAVAEGAVIRGGRATALSTFRIVAAAEAAGAAAVCLEKTSGYAKVRHAFGRPIGQYQAVKQHCAVMATAAELATAVAWDAARAAGGPEEPLAAAVAAAVALDSFLLCAELTVQLHGGIGFTWEHDAHLFFRRAVALASLAGPVDTARAEVTALVVAGARRRFAVDLPPEAEEQRAAVAEFVARVRALPEAQRHPALVEEGYLFPHWPAPWGRGADAVAQIVIEEEFADLDRMAGLDITSWILPIVLPTIMKYGTDEQQRRWIGPTLAGELTWCQLFSEPEAGSDLAALRTTATKVDGGWEVTGSKVWTSTAQFATLGFALVRTDPSAAKHRGITCMAIDMTAPGMDIRPLREMTGADNFSEEFLDSVFVPDEDVIGEINDGWRVARTTLGNERVSLGSGQGNRTLGALEGVRPDARDGARGEIGALLAEEQAIRLVNLRQASAAIIGGDPGTGGNMTKLRTAEHTQKVAELAVRLAGADGVFATEATDSLLASRAVTIAGGTSEIVRNTIAEQVLGLPRDPRP